jgi:hypothetical protein
MDGPVQAAGLFAGIGAGVLALVFARSTAHKLAEFSFYRATLGEYRLLPALFIGPVAVALTIAEALDVALLIVPTTRVVGAVLATVLLCLYAIAMAVNLQRGRFSIDCGCGGPGQAISWALVVRNLVLFAVGGYVATNASPFAAGAAATLVAFGGVLLCWLLVAVFDQIIGNHTRIVTGDL